MIQRTYVLAGAHHGKTIRLGKFDFVNGRCRLVGTEEDVKAWGKSIEVNWQGYPEGDPRIAEVNSTSVAIISPPPGDFEPMVAPNPLASDSTPPDEGASDGQRDVQEGGSEPDGQGNVQSDVQPEGQGTSTGVASDVQPGDGDGEAREETAAGPHGDGQPAQLNQKLLKAVMSLDHANNDHWTREGKPSMSALEKLYGASDITRAQVDAVAPGYRRQAQQG